MSSFKSAAYEPVLIFGYDGIYTNDDIEDDLPKGFHKYSLTYIDDRRMLTNKNVKSKVATIITREPVLSKKDKEVYETDLVFKNDRFVFDEYFKGVCRPIDYTIKQADEKRDNQAKYKAKYKTQKYTRAYDMEH